MLNVANKLEVTVHLRDAWVHTLVQEGDVVNLVANVDEHDGGFRALCDSGKGNIRCWEFSCCLCHCCSGRSSFNSYEATAEQLLQSMLCKENRRVRSAQLRAKNAKV